MKSAKKSVFVCGLALVACVALLVGATLAWFTDSVSNEGNKIVAGSLDIGAYAFDTGTGGTKVTIENKEYEFEALGADLEKETDPIIYEEAWEPGKSDAKLLEVRNKGTLATDIKLEFSIAGELIPALWFDFVSVTGEAVGSFTKRPMSELTALAEQTELTLNPAGQSGDSVRFVFFYGMYESAGIEYAGKEFTADVTIMAKQTEEGANYDNAVVVKPESGETLSSTEFAAALNDPEWQNKQIAAPVVIEESTNIYTDSNIDFSDNEVSLQKTLYFGRNNSYGSQPVTVTLENGNFVSSNSSGRIRFESDCSAVFKSSTFTGTTSNAGSAIQVYADNSEGKNTYVFEDCVFDGTYVSFEGASGSSYEFDVSFVNCTFTGALGNGGSLVAFDDYLYGKLSFENCTFTATANGNATAGINVESYPDYIGENKVELILNGVTFDGTSKEGYYSVSRPVPVSIDYISTVLLTETGNNKYTIDGVAVTYDGMFMAGSAEELTAFVNAAGNKYETQIRLTNDIDLGDSVVTGLNVSVNTRVALDLNGKKLTGASSAAQTVALVRNDGTLKIYDSSDGGEIALVYSGAGDNYSAGAHTIQNLSVLEVYGGTVKVSTVEDTDGKMISAIDNNSTNREATFTMKGGVVDGGNYYGIRMFCNSINNVNKVTLYAGKVLGGDRGQGVWLQTPNTNANKGEFSMPSSSTAEVYGTMVGFRAINYYAGADTVNVKVTVEGGKISAGGTDGRQTARFKFTNSASTKLTLKEECFENNAGGAIFGHWDDNESVWKDGLYTA